MKLCITFFSCLPREKKKGRKIFKKYFSYRFLYPSAVKKAPPDHMEVFTQGTQTGWYFFKWMYESEEPHMAADKSPNT